MRGKPPTVHLLIAKEDTCHIYNTHSDISAYSAGKQMKLDEYYTKQSFQGSILFFQLSFTTCSHETNNKD